jgi:hypothetical protein
MNAAAASSDKAAGKGLVVTGFILSTLLTGLVTLGVGVYNNAYQATRSERTAQVDKFAQSAQEFDPLVRQFVAEEGKGRLTVKTKEALRSNLLKQHSSLESVRSVASESATLDIDNYDGLVVRADSAIKAANTVDDSQSFAQAALDLGTRREALLKELRTPPSLTLH